MERSDGAFQKVMRTAETEIDSFGASGSGPMHEKLRAAYRFVPSRAPESRPRAMLRSGVERPLAERSRSSSAVKRSGEYQERLAEEARYRESSMRAERRGEGKQQ